MISGHLQGQWVQCYLIPGPVTSLQLGAITPLVSGWVNIINVRKSNSLQTGGLETKAGIRYLRIVLCLKGFQSYTKPVT